MKFEGIPLDISRMIYSPRRLIYGFLVKNKNIPGVLAKTSAIFAKNKVNIVNCIVSITSPEALVVTELFFCDFTECKIKPEEIKEELEKLKEVINVKLIKPILPGLLIDNVHFPLYVAHNRSVVFRLEILSGLIKGLKTQWGSAADVFLYYAGVQSGDFIWKSHEVFTEDPIQRLEVFELFFKACGFGIMEISFNLPSKKARVKVLDSFECELGKGSKKPYSQFIRGMIAGFLKNFFKSSVDVTEVKCLAKGDEFCLFEVRAL